jgi:hypothetical protein
MRGLVDISVNIAIGVAAAFLIAFGLTVWALTVLLWN